MTNKVIRGLGVNRDVIREENDFYATDPKAVEELLKVEKFDNKIWEPAAGMGHISKKLEEYGYDVKISDLIDRGIGADVKDFLLCDEVFDGDIITNPPFKYGEEFVYKALSLTKNKVAMFLKIQFLESKSRRRLFDLHPPRKIWVFSNRIATSRGGDEELFKDKGTICFCWFIWEKDYTGKTELGWIN